jgi:hypothetical protein
MIKQYWIRTNICLSLLEWARGIFLIHEGSKIWLSTKQALLIFTCVIENNRLIELNHKNLGGSRKGNLLWKVPTFPSSQSKASNRVTRSTRSLKNSRWTCRVRRYKSRTWSIPLTRNWGPTSLAPRKTPWLTYLDCPYLQIEMVENWAYLLRLHSTFLCPFVLAAIVSNWEKHKD